MPFPALNRAPQECTGRHSSSTKDETKFPSSESCSYGQHVYNVPGARRRPCLIWKRILLNTWFGEVSAMIFSLACMAAIGLTLRLYSGKTIPELPYGLTLNAVVSILGTAAKSSLIFADAGALGQLKWCWFIERSRRLQDLQSFDDASRGPLGSVTMLFSFSWRHMASLAAIITILTLAYDPFIQQVLDYPVRQFHKPSIAANTAKSSGFTVDFDSSRFTNTINSGMWADQGQFERRPPCQSGNCTWPLFRSLCWCSKCTDLTGEAKFGECDIQGFWDTGHNHNITCDLALGYGASGSTYGNNVTAVQCALRDVAVESGMVAPGATRSQPYCGVATEITWGMHYAGEYAPDFHFDSFLDVDTPILVLGHASMNYSGAVPKVTRAEACAITTCARDYLVTIVNCITDVDVVNIDYGRVLNNGEKSIEWWQSNGLNTSQGVQELQKSSSGLSNQSQSGPDISHLVVEYVSLYAAKLEEFFEGNRTRVAEDFDAMFDAENWISDEDYLRSYEDNYSSEIMKKIETTNLSYVTDNVAASLTKLGLTLSNETGKGNVTTSETYVRMSWKWMILPIYLEVTAVYLLSITILLNYRRQTLLWKSSILPLLYHGVPYHTFERHPGSDACDMEASARDTFVALAPSNEKKGSHRLRRTVKR